MIKLKDILTEVRFNIGYHTAPAVVMGSINKHGLNPKLSKYYSSDEIYFFRDKTEAHSYAVHMAHYDSPKETWYIMEVDLTGIDLKKDMGLNPSQDEAEDSAYYTTKPIPANKIKVIDKV